jgi:hypothetical protein
VITSDLQSSTRLASLGLTSVLSDVVKLCFAGEPFIPPPETQPLLEILVSDDHALCHINVKGRKILHV